MPAGDKLTAAMLATRVGTAKLTANSAAYTAETVGLTVSSFLEAGKTYSITGIVRVLVSAGTFPVNETTQLRIREDTVSGTQLNIAQYLISSNTGVGFTCHVYAEYTASATGSKTFVLTGQRNSGSANHQMTASASSPGFLFVDLLPS